MAVTGPLLISTMKNEGPYILEWIAYHRVIGFTDFLIYTNDCEDGTVELLDRLTEMGIVQHERNEVLRRGPHKSALKYALAHPMTAESDWIMVGDVDEFLNIHIGDGSVRALIDAQPEGTDAIPVTWRLFSHDERVSYRDELLLEQFTDAERSLAMGGFPDRFVKTIFRKVELLERFGLHRPVVAPEHIAGYVSRHPDGTLFNGDMRHSKADTHFAYEAAQVNHYAVRSIDSYLIKRDRGRANHAGQVLGADYWQRMCRGGQEDRTIQRHLPALRAELDTLRADPQLAAIHRAAVSWHSAKIDQLRTDPAFEALREEILALSAAEDHLRLRTDQPAPLRIVADTATPPPVAPPPVPKAPPPASPVTGADPRMALIQLCAQMRGIIDMITPVEAAEAAHQTLDQLERGLSGTQSR